MYFISYKHSFIKKKLCYCLSVQHLNKRVKSNASELVLINFNLWVIGHWKLFWRMNKHHEASWNSLFKRKKWNKNIFREMLKHSCWFELGQKNVNCMHVSTNSQHNEDFIKPTVVWWTKSEIFKFFITAQSKKNIVSGIKFVQKSIRKGDHSGWVYL